jgi:hypothetical protein
MMIEMENKKGYLYTLEMLFAIAVIFGAIVFVFKASPDKPITEIGLIKQQGFDALQYMDESGNLKKYYYENNQSALDGELNNILTKSISFKADMCKYDCSQDGIPGNQTIIIVDYYISGCRTNFNPGKIRLYLWKTF